MEAVTVRFWTLMLLVLTVRRGGPSSQTGGSKGWRPTGKNIPHAKSVCEWRVAQSGYAMRRSMFASWRLDGVAVDEYGA